MHTDEIQVVGDLAQQGEHGQREAGRGAVASAPLGWGSGLGRHVLPVLAAALRPVAATTLQGENRADNCVFEAGTAG